MSRAVVMAHRLTSLTRFPWSAEWGYP